MFDLEMMFFNCDCWWMVISLQRYEGIVMINFLIIEIKVYLLFHICKKKKTYKFINICGEYPIALEWDFLSLF